MNPDRRFEDKLKFEDLLTKPAEEIRALTYMQTVKTNGEVIRHEKKLIELEDDLDKKCDKDHFDDVKSDIKEIKEKQEKTLSSKGFYTAAVILGIITAYLAVIQSLATLGCK